MRSARGVLAASCVTLGVLGIGAQPASAVECISLTPDQYKTLARRAGPIITSGSAVVVPAKNRLTSPSGANWPSHLVALTIAGTSMPAVLAVGGVGGTIRGPIDSLNDAALDATEFGAAAQPGSTALRNRKKLRRIPQVSQVKKCAESG
jgi:hypothetical protein